MAELFENPGRWGAQGLPFGGGGGGTIQEWWVSIAEPDGLLCMSWTLGIEGSRSAGRA